MANNIQSRLLSTFPPTDTIQSLEWYWQDTPTITAILSVQDMKHLKTIHIITSRLANWITDRLEGSETNSTHLIEDLQKLSNALKQQDNKKQYATSKIAPTSIRMESHENEWKLNIHLRNRDDDKCFVGWRSIMHAYWKDYRKADVLLGCMSKDSFLGLRSIKETSKLLYDLTVDSLENREIVHKGLLNKLAASKSRLNNMGHISVIGVPPADYNGSDLVIKNWNKWIDEAQRQVKEASRTSV